MNTSLETCKDYVKVISKNFLKDKLAGKILVTMNCPPKRPRRNGLCNCGSGRKFKNCCG